MKEMVPLYYPLILLSLELISDGGSCQNHFLSKTGGAEDELGNLFYKKVKLTKKLAKK